MHFSFIKLVLYIYVYSDFKYIKHFWYHFLLKQTNKWKQLRSLCIPLHASGRLPLLSCCLQCNPGIGKCKKAAGGEGPNWMWETWGERRSSWAGRAVRNRDTVFSFLCWGSFWLELIPRARGPRQSTTAIKISPNLDERKKKENMLKF